MLSPLFSCPELRAAVTSNRGGKTWQQLTVKGTAYYPRAVQYGDSHGYLHRSSDAGRTWQSSRIAAPGAGWARFRPAPGQWSTAANHQGVGPSVVPGAALALPCSGAAPHAGRTPGMIGTPQGR
jgi:hypothetical protein